jgi:secondary thiamine-phosphate synthase enzyme
VNRSFITIKTEKQFTDLNNIARDFVKDKTGQGMLNIYVRHTTCAIKILENEILLLADINNYLDKQFNNGHDYMHDKIEIRDVPIEERINGHSHMKQLGFPTSEQVPVEDGSLLLGTWQTIFLIEFDPIREREIVLSYSEL